MRHDFALFFCKSLGEAFASSVYLVLTPSCICGSLPEWVRLPLGCSRRRRSRRTWNRRNSRFPQRFLWARACCRYSQSNCRSGAVHPASKHFTTFAEIAAKKLGSPTPSDDVEKIRLMPSARGGVVSLNGTSSVADGNPARLVCPPQRVNLFSRCHLRASPPRVVGRTTPAFPYADFRINAQALSGPCRSRLFALMSSGV